MKVEIDTAREVITINGINFAFSLFDALAFAEIGSELRIVGREHGVVTMERFYPARPNEALKAKVESLENQLEDQIRGQDADL